MVGRNFPCPCGSGLKFKVLEGKLEAYLPKGIGVADSTAAEKLKFEVEIRRVVPAPTLEQLEAGVPWQWAGDQLRVAAGGSEVASLEELYERLRCQRERLPDLQVTLRPRSSPCPVVHADVVHVLDACMKARVADLVFAAER
ncbi:MAG: SEC-C metal-binding domain-containing protein [Planctomycetota bacterium]